MMTDRKTYTMDELQSILDLHRKWLYNEDGGSRADLRRADLRRAYLSGADLRRADLSGADLSRADLSRAYLSGAYLSGADLSRAYLSGADLRRADLSGADLSRADLSGADLSRADLSGAKNAELALARTSIVPDGEIIGWKKVAAVVDDDKVGEAIVKLRVPADAARSNATGRKCRCSKAEVLAIEPLGDLPGGCRFASLRDHSFPYEAGATVEPEKPFCDDRFDECASGIHFFITREEAEAWVW